MPFKVAPGRIDDDGRTCTKCGHYKLRKEFMPRPTAAGGMNPQCRECISAYKKEYNCLNPSVARQSRERQRRRRLEVLSKYCTDGVLKCACCGETEPHFLGLDHIEGGGGKERRCRGGSTGLLGYLKRNGFPPGYQVLCHNCNLAKGFYGICPHQEKIA